MPTILKSARPSTVRQVRANPKLKISINFETQDHKHIADAKENTGGVEKLEEITNRLNNNYNGITSLDDNDKKEGKKVIALKG